MTEYVVVLDEDSRARLLHLCNEKLASSATVAAGPLFRARDALTWAIPTEAAEARTELVLHDWWMTASGNLECDPDWADAAPHIVGGLRNVEPPSDERKTDA